MELISPETSLLIGGHATGSGIQACLEYLLLHDIFNLGSGCDRING